MGAAFLCAASGISPPTIEQSAAYMQGWIDVLKGDKRLVVNAAGAAQKAADLILGTTFNDTAEAPVTTDSPKLSAVESLSERTPSRKSTIITQPGLF